MSTHFLAWTWASNAYSEDVARTIDSEVRRIIETAYERCKGILSNRLETLKLLAETLLEKEVLDRQEFLKLLNEPATA